MSRVSEIGGKRVPFLRWSFWRMALGAKHLTTHWQVGDGREEALAEHVTANAARGDLDDAIRAIDGLDTGRRGGPEPDAITLEAFGREIPEA